MKSLASGMDTDRKKDTEGMIPSKSAIRIEELDVKSGMDDLMEVNVEGIIAMADFTQVLTFLIVNSGLRFLGISVGVRIKKAGGGYKINYVM